jgi:hypothetical protein
VALPGLQVRRIKAKLDTGARTSALHAFKLTRFRADGRDMVRFEVHPVQRSAAASVTVEAEVVDEREVRNSGGNVEVRPVIVTPVRMGGEEWPIEVTLTRRDEMGFRLLLGRRAFRGRTVVDAAASFVCGEDPHAPAPPWRETRPGRRGRVQFRRASGGEEE